MDCGRGIQFHTFLGPKHLFKWPFHQYFDFPNTTKLIPPLSAHPSSCFKGLIFGELKGYQAQNNAKDFTEIFSKFNFYLCKRGHNMEKLVPLIMQAVATLNFQFTTSKPEMDNNNHNTMNIHILQPHIPFNTMQVTIFQQKKYLYLSLTFSVFLKHRVSHTLFFSRTFYTLCIIRVITT